MDAIGFVAAFLLATGASPASAGTSDGAGSEWRIEEKDEVLRFTYTWPRSAGAIQKLHARFEAEMKALRKDARATAQEDKAERSADIPFNAHYFAKEWEEHGRSERLLSLAAAIETFTGGAHGNTAYDAILWDRSADREIGFGELFADRTAALTELRPIYCEALDRERSERREEPLPLEGDEWMTGCPELAERVIVPSDHDDDGRFETITVLIPPYEAGPYAEGTYVIEVPLTAGLARLVKPGYSASFETDSQRANAQPQ